jgi:cellulose synthase/poly-beta-1,6-N-acetylglucosamine synthase-like glycosyltransferase/spore germination protein YaaH/peptidoglycan/xylan/chitin deacetylase (PgdA/CDA1 family)
MASKPVFYDPKQIRRRRTRQITILTVIVTASLLVLFSLSILEAPLLPTLILPTTSHGFRPANLQANRKKLGRRRRRPFTLSKPGTGRGQPLRAAFYVNWDPTSLTSLKAHYKDIGLLIPEWLTMTTPDGHLGMEQDEPVLRWLRSVNSDIPVMPMLSNFDMGKNRWCSNELEEFLKDPNAQNKLLASLEGYVRIRHFAGVVLDFEEIPDGSQPAFRQFAIQLVTRIHREGGKLLISVPAADPKFDYRFFGQVADAVIALNYDEHYSSSEPGPVASYPWFVKSMQDISRWIPPEKILVGIGCHGYDWTMVPKPPLAQSLSFQESLVTAQESEAKIDFDSDELNPEFEYIDEKNQRHEVWFLDAVSSYNEIVEADRMGMAGVVLWHLGAEDPTLWTIFPPGSANAAHRELLKTTSDWYDLDKDGDGEILRVLSLPKSGTRSFEYDDKSGLITDEDYEVLPIPYHLQLYGGLPRKVVLSFDDGPDPTYTPEILDILKAKHAPGVFFTIGLEADKFPGLLRRYYNEGHEIGNHTFTHPDISQLPQREFEMELNLTQRLFESELGIKTIFFRPPYDVDSDPDTPAEIRPLDLVQQLGYVTIGDKIDPKDYLSHDPAQILKDTMDQLSTGHIILLHDGGGDRTATVEALPEMIDQIRAHGMQIVSLGTLLGKTRDQVMPRLGQEDRWKARTDLFIFNFISFGNSALAWIFLAAILLVSGRLIFIGLLAGYQKLRRPPPQLPDDFRPTVTVLIPAYNEEPVVVRTVNSVLASDWPNVEVVVVNDGSRDATAAVLEQAFGSNPRVHILHQPNQGKPAALNHGLSAITGEILVGVDADTRIDPGTIRALVRHFADPNVAAVAGNAKVANRHNLLTRWQALEYITSQNLDRRAFDVLNCITVVPGAVGAWRTSVVRECGGFSPDTVAEDTDLTLTIRRRGYRISYDDDAIAWTEAPERWSDLIRQRFRWTFGTFQSVWKHRDTLLRRRYGALGSVAIPNVIIFQLVLPMFSPVVDLMMAWSIFWWVFARILQHWPVFVLPQAFAIRNDNLISTLLFFLIFTAVDLLACELAFLMEKGESHLLLFWLIPQRFAYRQMMYFVLARTVLRAIEGTAVGWGRIERPAPRAA